MVSKSSVFASFVLATGLSLLGNSVQAATNNDFNSKKQYTKEEIDTCRNANTLIFQRAAFFNQTSATGTVFPHHGYSRPPERGISVFAGSTSEEEGRDATASLNDACAADPTFRLKNPAQEFDVTKFKPNLDTPRLFPKKG